MKCALWTTRNFKIVETLVAKELIDIYLWFDDKLKITVGGIAVIILEDEVKVGGKTFAYRKQNKKWIIEFLELDDYLIKVTGALMHILSDD
ncbi:hypothetical protein BNJ_00058 [Kaumoebavirus]|uniref:hypothetical protein n=1 Tax=Kaumoebavirus TaxID=1859492 RepID=UPI0009C21277|nr:hypothetical protein BNJ_00058 [Kaumoebavirus]ARA71900.1 hypothetical protein BNJ_00058 [Kaumoebavirus]